MSFTKNDQAVVLNRESLQYLANCIRLVHSLPDLLNDVLPSQTTAYSSYKITELLNTLNTDLQNYVNNALGNLSHLKKEIVSVAPTDSSADEDTIYLVQDASGGYEQYLKINGVVTSLGSTSAINNVYTKAESDGKFGLLSTLNSLITVVGGLNDLTTTDKTSIVNAINELKTDLTSHTSDTDVHITTTERDKWNEIDNKVDKTNIATSIDSTSTNNEVVGAKAFYDNAIKDKNIKTYTNVSQLGLTTPISMGDLFVGLPDNSLLRISCDNDEITGVPHRNGILIIDKCNASKFSIEFKISSGGSVNNNTLYIGQLKGVDGTGLTWQRVCTTNDTDIHVTTGDKAKWNEVDNKVDKSSITTTINSTSTDTKVPSAKSVYDNAIKDKNIKTYTNVSQLGLKYPITVGEIFNAMPSNSMAHLMADTNSKITDCPSANGILIIDKCYMSKFSIEFKVSASGETATNTLYIGQLKGSDGSGLTWRRVCTTSIADVPVTNIAPADTTTFINFKGNSNCNYCVKNGICYVSLWGVKIAKTGGTIKSGVILPKSANNIAGALMIGASDATEHAFAFIIGTGELCFDVKDANIPLHCSFSYPVKEQ